MLDLRHLADFRVELGEPIELGTKSIIPTN